MPQIYATNPAPPAHGTCRVLQVDDAPTSNASGAPSKMLENLPITAAADFGTVMRVTKMHASSHWRAAVRQRSHGSAFGILQSEPELFCERLDGRAASLPLAFRFEPQIADAAPPGGNDTADSAKIAALGVFLVKPAHDVRSDTNERP